LIEREGAPNIFAHHPREVYHELAGGERLAFEVAQGRRTLASEVILQGNWFTLSAEEWRALYLHGTGRLAPASMKPPQQEPDATQSSAIGYRAELGSLSLIDGNEPLCLKL
jgi:hypothetical protein